MKFICIKILAAIGYGINKKWFGWFVVRWRYDLGVLLIIGGVDVLKINRSIDLSCLADGNMRFLVAISDIYEHKECLILIEGHRRRLLLLYFY